MSSEDFDRGWNEALEAVLGRLHEEGGYGGDEIRDIILNPLKRPQPPAQQDDKPEIEWRTGSEWEDVDGADESKPIVPSTSPSFDIESRARELMSMEHEGAIQSAIALAREAHAAGAREKAEEIAREIDRINRIAPRRAVEEHCAAIARSHARPPQSAPETREERYRKALEQIRKGTAPQVAIQDICRRALETKP